MICCHNDGVHGSGPRESQGRGSLSYIFGAETSLVIRRSTENDSDEDLTSVLVGESYIPGMMERFFIVVRNFSMTLCWYDIA